MIKINLLPEEKKKRKKRKEAKPYPKIVVTIGTVTFATLLITGGAVYFFKSNISQLKEQTESNKAAIANLKKKTEEVKKYEKLNKEFEQRNNLIENLRKNQSVPVRILDDVSAMIPEGVWLNSMNCKDKDIVIEGYAFTNIDVVAYVANLKKSVNITDINLDESRQTEVEKVSVYKFKLSFKVKV
jgi:Tfp pilus assembly protein PilN